MFSIKRPTAINAIGAINGTNCFGIKLNHRKLYGEKKELIEPPIEVRFIGLFK